jgi:hypothetical protein
MRLIAAFMTLFFPSISAFSRTDSRVDLTCEMLVNGEVKLTSKNEKYFFALLKDRSTCDVAYSFEADKDIPSSGVVLAGATEINLSSSENVYRISSTGVSTHIGQIPTGANYVGYRTYENITQTAGSFYLTVYAINNDGVLPVSEF